MGGGRGSVQKASRGWCRVRGCGREKGKRGRWEGEQTLKGGNENQELPVFGAWCEMTLRVPRLHERRKGKEG